MRYKTTKIKFSFEKTIRDKHLKTSVWPLGGDHELLDSIIL